MDEQLELEAPIQQEMAAQRRLRRGRDAPSCRSARRALHRALTDRGRPAARGIASSCARRLRRHLLAALAAMLAVLRASRSRPADPGRRSPNANEIHRLYMIMLVIAPDHLRRRRGRAALRAASASARARARVAAQIRGNTRLEVGWTVGAALILVVLAVVTFAKLRRSRTRPTRAPTGRQPSPARLRRRDRPAPRRPTASR